MELGATGTVEEDEMKTDQELFTQEHLAENPGKTTDLHIAPGARKRKTYAHPNRAIEHPGGHYTGGCKWFCQIFVDKFY